MVHNCLLRNTLLVLWGFADKHAQCVMFVCLLLLFADESISEKEEKLDRQIGLSGLLAALNIKAGKLHNAGEQ